jgi:sigma-B regulation protein RsbU (phosphoserine phosphatase)
MVIDTTATTQKRLRYNVLLETLSDEEFCWLEERLHQRHFLPDQVIIEDETRGEEVFFLVEGRVRISKKMQSGEDQLLAVLHPGDCFGELELIAGRPRSARVIAVDPSTAFVLPRDEFTALLDRSHTFALRLLQVLSIRVRSMNYHFIRESNRKLDYTRRELHKLEQLIDATKKVNSTLNLDELLDIILDMALRMVEGDRGTVYLVDEAKQQIWTKVSKELEGQQRVTIALPIGKGIAGYVAATGDIINIPDAYMDPRFDPEFDKKTGYRTESILCMPLRNKGNKIIGVFQLLNKRHGVFTNDDATFIEALSVHASLAIENARLYEQERQKIRIERDLLAAKEVQLSLLPKSLPDVPGYEFAAATISAQEVAGDLYDFLAIDPKRLAFCVGDVSGKGLPASLLMANTQATLRDQTHVSTSASDCMVRTNNLLFQSTSPEKFVTLFYGVLDFEKHQLSYSNAGHEQPFFDEGGTTFLRLGTGGLVLGIVEDYPFQEETVSFRPGGVLVIYSDGISDALNDREERFGEEKLSAVIRNHHRESASAIKEAILDAVRSHVGGAPTYDDMTLVLVKRNETR